MQFLDGLKHLLSAIVSCCDSEIYKQPRGLDSPEALARETVCMSSETFNFINFFEWNSVATSVFASCSFRKR